MNFCLSVRPDRWLDCTSCAPGQRDDSTCDKKTSRSLTARMIQEFSQSLTQDLGSTINITLLNEMGNVLRSWNVLSLISSVPSNYFYSCADLLLLWAENFYTNWRLRGTLKVFLICIIIIFTLKIEKFQLRSNNSVCAGVFRLLRGRAPAHLRGNIACLRSLFGGQRDWIA
jgi:hypothetical protein